MELRNLNDLLEAELKDIYSAESQLIDALPKVAKAASDPQLKKSISAHLEETKGQKRRLDQIGEILEMDLAGKTCKAMKGLLAEGNEDLQEKVADPGLRDVLIIGAAKRIEHYEMAAYESARAIAEELGEGDVAELLTESLEEEIQADELLTRVNQEAVFPKCVESSDDDRDDDHMKGRKRKGSPEANRKGNQSGSTRESEIR